MRIEPGEAAHADEWRRMTTYRGTYGDVVHGSFTLDGVTGGFILTTIVTLTFDDVRRVAGDIVSAVVSANGNVEFRAIVNGEIFTTTDPLEIEPAPFVFSLTAPDDLLPGFGAEYGYFGTNDAYFANTFQFFRDGVELRGGQPVLNLRSSGDYHWSDGRLSLTGTYDSGAELPLVSPLLNVRDNNTYITERQAAANGVTFEIERLDSALEPATVDWWVTGDTYYDYASESEPWYRQVPIYLDDFVDGSIPAGTLTFAAGEKVKTVTVHFADDSKAELTERVQFNVTQDTSGLFNIRSAGAATIYDDDPKPVLSIVARDAEQQEGTGGVATYSFEVSRSGNPGGAVWAVWGYRLVSEPNGRYADAADFAGGAYPSGVVTLEDGEVRKIITVDVAADGAAERDEIFTIVLYPQLLDWGAMDTPLPSARAVIRNDDAITDLVAATSKGVPFAVVPVLYAGPVPDIEKECVILTGESLVIQALGPNWFIHAGSGDDAVALAGGRNIVDAGTGSNFVSAAGGTDTVFVDARGATAPTWSTVAGMEAGDFATLWGVSRNTATLTWVDGWGAPGFTGITMVATPPGAPTICLTLAGLSQADMANDRLGVGGGYDWVSGSEYVNVWLRW